MFSVQVSVEVDDVMRVFNDEYSMVCRTVLRDCPVIDAMLSKLDAKIEAECGRVRELCPAMTAEEVSAVIDVSERNRARLALARQEVEQLLQQVDASSHKIKAALLW